LAFWNVGRDKTDRDLAGCIDAVLVQRQPLRVSDQDVGGNRAILRDLRVRDLENQAGSYEIDNSVTGVERLLIFGERASGSAVQADGSHQGQQHEYNSNN